MRVVGFCFCYNGSGRLTGFWGCREPNPDLISIVSHYSPHRAVLLQDTDQADDDREQNVRIALTVPRARNIALAPALAIIAR